ncbi:MAG: VWA domain-containing protein [Candidatus Eremiobacterota bacterium]
MQEKKCPNCGDSDKIDRNLLCHACGSQLQLDETTGTYILKLVDCPDCGHPNSSAANFCAKCRKQLIPERPVETEDKKGKNKLPAIFAVIMVMIIAFIVYNAAGKREKPHVSPVSFNPVHIVDPPAQHHINPPVIVVKPTPAPVKGNGPRMDVVFCVDTTGSMGDEIEVIREQLLKMVDEIKKGNPAPRVRFGVVAYKDRGDEYVTKKYDFSDNIQDTQEVINSLKASGGGDYEENIYEALKVSVEGMKWDTSKKVRKIIFIIGDASPHRDYGNDYDYKKELALASEKGIMINTVSCSGMQEDGNQFFQEVSSATNGTFEYLTYKYVYEDVTGKKQVRLTQGSKNYVVDERYKDSDDWRKGGRDMAGEGKAKEYESSSDYGSSSPFSSSVTGSAPPAPGEAPSKQVEQVNNLDSIMTDTLKKEAQKEGVSY